MPNKLFAILFSCIVLLSSCATIITGSRQTIEVNNKKADSVVKIKRGIFSPKTITVKKNGDKVVLKKKFNEVSTLNFILFPGWIIDIITGAIVKYVDPKTRE